MTFGRRVPFGIFIPVAMFAAAAALWTFVWYSAASRARDALTQWRAEFATQGRKLACAREQGGGFPFRLEFRCADPVLRMPVGGDTYVATAATLTAVAKAYDTQHMIFEINAPLRLERNGDAQPLISAEAGMIRASLELDNGRASRLSAVLPAWHAIVAGEGETASLIGAQAGEVHMRARPGEDAIDIAVSADDAHFPDHEKSATGARINVEHINLVTVINRPVKTSLADMESWLGKWRDGGGVADVRRMFFDSAYLTGEGAGTVNLTPNGQIEGALKVRFTRLDQFAEALLTRGVISDNDRKLLRTAVGLFAKSTNGQKSATLPVRIRDGQIYFGPVKVATLPALM